MTGPERSELRTLIDLALPVSLTQVGMMMMGIVDIWMVGRLGESALASVALGDLWIWGTIVIALGLLVGLDPLVTQAHGARNREKLGLTLQRGLLFAAFLAVPLTLVWHQAPRVLALFGQDPALLEDAGLYVDAQLTSALPILAFIAIRQYLQGRALVYPAMLAVLLGNFFNVAANEVLIFGHLGFPAMGVYGAGLATASSRFVLLFLLLYFMKRSKGLENGWIPWNRRSLKLSGFLPLLRYGTPVALHYGSEIWAFQIAALMAGKLGASALA
ncbi:MAG TPA: MATE family efflux transporter, partial [Planctomycetes bacterium]|nr:MATE family efflux transporter [Planctomycetota bacterium]